MSSISQKISGKIREICFEIAVATLQEGAIMPHSPLGSFSTHNYLCSGQASAKIGVTVSYSFTKLQSKIFTWASIKVHKSLSSLTHNRI